MEFGELVQTFGFPLAALMVVTIAFMTETVVPGKVRDREIAAERARTTAAEKRAERWEGAALRLVTLLDKSTETAAAAAAALLGRKDEV